MASDELTGTVAAVVATAVVAVLVYPETLVSLSITGRAVLLGVLLVSLLVIAATFRLQATVGILAFAAAFAVGMYTPIAYGYGGGAGFVVMIPLVIVVSVVIYQIQDGNLWLTRRTAAVVLAVLLVGSAAFVGVDLSVGDVDYEVTVNEGLDVPAREQTQFVTVGESTARSTSFLREPAEYPDVRACLYTESGVTDLTWQYDGGAGAFGRSVPGNGERTVDLQVLLNETQVKTLPDELPVERADACPDSRADPGIVIVVDESGS
ncbi:MAG: hypothetical protein ABEJ40_02230 [Haloarculaceae archaeon]